GWRRGWSARRQCWPAARAPGSNQWSPRFVRANCLYRDSRGTIVNCARRLCAKNGNLVDAVENGELARTVSSPRGKLCQQNRQCGRITNETRHSFDVVVKRDTHARARVPQIANQTRTVDEKQEK